LVWHVSLSERTSFTGYCWHFHAFYLIYIVLSHAGIPGISASLLEEFGVRLVTYDLPGFGESDPHVGRNLNSSAMDMLYLANALNIPEKFWVVGYSGGGMHAWSALHYIPDRIAGTYFMVFFYIVLDL
jgi:pimeloyl-ACP methyl ester carboxylesterase